MKNSNAVQIDGSPRGATRSREAKRRAILKAAETVFAEEGLEGASLRQIAAKAGYTPAALYFHFASKEALYAALLHASLERLLERVEHAVGTTTGPGDRIKRTGLAFFDFYADNPRHLDLGFYLFRGGMGPKGLGREADAELNAALAATLQPITDAARHAGLGEAKAQAMTTDCFAHATGLLLLLHTGRIRMFGQPARRLMEEFLDVKASILTEESER